MYIMNILVDTLLLFVHMSLMFYYEFPDISNNNYLFHKIVIFVFVFIFKFFVELIKKLFEKKNKIDAKDIISTSAQYSLYSVIGYSVYIDLMYMNFPIKFLCFNITTDNQRIVTASAISTLTTILLAVISDSTKGLF